MLYDAHNHLHDARLAPHLPAILATLRPLEIRAAVVNGTRAEDWQAVADLARDHAWIVPSFGLHPWYAPRRADDWQEVLRSHLRQHPGAGVGEIGLDRWIEGHDLADQTRVFTAQLAIAAEENRPVTIHCIRAWGALWEVIRTHPLPARGFLIHAYGGPVEMLDGFAGRGACFSFSPSFLAERKSAQREAFRHIPADRLLVETDAPDLGPPPEKNRHPLTDADGHPLNHPANLVAAYAALAEVRGCPESELQQAVADNFHRLFGRA